MADKRKGLLVGVKRLGPVNKFLFYGFLVSVALNFLFGHLSHYYYVQSAKEHSFNDIKRDILHVLSPGDPKIRKEQIKKAEKYFETGDERKARATAEALIIDANRISGKAEKQQEIIDIFKLFVAKTGNIYEIIKFLENINNKYCPGEFVRFYHALSFCYAFVGNFERCESTLREAIKEWPNDAITYHYLGRVYLMQGKYQKAIDCYKGGIEVDGDYANLYMEIGDVYYYKKQYNKALEYYEKSKEYWEGGTNWDPSFLMKMIHIHFLTAAPENREQLGIKREAIDFNLWSSPFKLYRK